MNSVLFFLWSVFGFWVLGWGGALVLSIYSLFSPRPFGLRGSARFCFRYSNNGSIISWLVVTEGHFGGRREETSTHPDQERAKNHTGVGWGLRGGFF